MDLCSLLVIQLVAELGGELSEPLGYDETGLASGWPEKESFSKKEGALLTAVW